jgi:hypothetical protein
MVSSRQIAQQYSLSQQVIELEQKVDQEACRDCKNKDDREIAFCHEIPEIVRLKSGNKAS